MMQQRLFEKISKVVLKSNIDEHEVVPVSLEKKRGEIWRIHYRGAPNHQKNSSENC